MCESHAHSLPYHLPQRQGQRFPLDMPAELVHTLFVFTAGVGPVWLRPGALRISIALSRQKRALAGRFKVRYSASSSSVMCGLFLSASMVICSLSGFPSVGILTTGALMPGSLTVFTSSRPIATICPVIGRLGSLASVSRLATVEAPFIPPSIVCAEPALLVIESRLAALKRLPLAKARRSVAIGRLVCLASSVRADNCCAFSCFSSMAVSEIVSAIMV